MSKDTYEALKRIINDYAYNKYGYQGKKAFDKVAKDIKQVEGWIDEVAKEYDDKRYCHLCDSEEKDKWCTNPSCAEYRKHE